MLIQNFMNIYFGSKASIIVPAVIE